MKTKIQLGKPTLRSIEIQVLTILQPLFEGGIEILKIRPKRTDTGNMVLVGFKVLNEPEVRRSSVFAMQRYHNCCDIWLEGPSTPPTKTTETNSAA
jgi:hypothetical protein